MKIAIILGAVLLIGLAVWGYRTHMKKQTSADKMELEVPAARGNNSADSPQTQALASGVPVLSQASAVRAQTQFLANVRRPIGNLGANIAVKHPVLARMIPFKRRAA